MQGGGESNKDAQRLDPKKSTIGMAKKKKKGTESLKP